MRKSGVREVMLPLVPAGLLVADSHRLKLSLDLPTITPRPPVPPRVYKKIYGYISSALSVTATPSRAAARYRDYISRTATSTPSKSRTRVAESPSQTPRSERKQAEDGRFHVNEDEEAPQWVMPAIRAVCKTFKKPDAAPHVFAGVSSVLKAHRTDDDELELQRTPSRKRKRPSGTARSPTAEVRIGEEHITALIAVITFYTLSELGEAPEKEEYLHQRKRAVETLAMFEPRRPRDEKCMIADIELFMREAQNGWLDMDWYRNIFERRANRSIAEDETQSSEDELADDVDDVDFVDDVMGMSNEASIRGGFGTMFSDAVDWLSEDRKADYVQWKKKILAKIAEIEKEYD